MRPAGDPQNRQSGGSYRTPARGEVGHPELSGLFLHWKRGAPGFRRPAPPPEPPLPLAFVCKACSAKVSPSASRCPSCGAALWASS